MERFIPYEKLSKKKKRELAAARRSRWDRSPVTRRPANPRAYDRRKARKESQDDLSVPSLCPDAGISAPHGA